MSEQGPTPISEGVLIQRERVLAMRDRIENLLARVEAKESDYRAARRQLTMIASHDVDRAIDASVPLEHDLEQLREMSLALTETLESSYVEEDRLLAIFSNLEDRMDAIEKQLAE